MYKNLFRRIILNWRYILCGAVLLFGISWLLINLVISGKIILPNVIKEPGDFGKPFVGIEDGALRIGTNTIRISRFRLDMGNLKITNLATPTSAKDAANKEYVDAQRVGYINWNDCEYKTVSRTCAQGAGTASVSCSVGYDAVGFVCGGNWSYGKGSGVDVFHTSTCYLTGVDTLTINILNCGSTNAFLRVDGSIKCCRYVAP